MQAICALACAGVASSASLNASVTRFQPASHTARAKTDAGVRIVHLLPILRRVLAEYRDRLEPSPNRRVFATSSGGTMGATNVRIRMLARAVERADAALAANGRQPLPEGLTPHSLRRTFASLLFALGEPPTYVMSQMGTRHRG